MLFIVGDLVDKSIRTRPSLILSAEVEDRSSGWVSQSKKTKLSLGLKIE